MQTDKTDGTRSKKPRRLKKIIALTLAFILCALSALGVGYWWYTSKLDKQVARLENPFSSIEESARPQTQSESECTNILVLGSDSRISDGDLDKWQVGAQRSDVMMVVQFSPGTNSLSVLSIPRDSWVDIPGYGKGKINWAFSYGGPALAVQTVENLLGVRLDHYAVMDFTTFTNLTDELGGVTMTTATEGTRHYNGEEALKFVRERKSLPNGDIDRGRRHQQWLKAIMKSAKDSGALTSFSKINNLLNIATQSVAVDDAFTFADMRHLASVFTSIPAENIHFITMPNLGSAWQGDQSTITVDFDKLSGLAQAWQSDTVDQYVKEQGDNLLTLDQGTLY